MHSQFTSNVTKVIASDCHFLIHPLICFDCYAFQFSGALSHLFVSKTASKGISIQYCKNFVILLSSGKEKKKSFPKCILSNIYLQEIQTQRFYWSSLEKTAQALCIKTACNDNCGQLLFTFVYRVISPNLSET